jgi:hypothetical protein
MFQENRRRNMQDMLIALLQTLALLAVIIWIVRRRKKKKTAMADAERVNQMVEGMRAEFAARHPPETHLTYTADYSVRTPLAALEADGQRWAMDSPEAPPVILGGRWDIGKYRWCDLEIADDKRPKYKLFLLALRKACETEGSPTEKLARMKALASQPDCSEWYAQAERHYAYKAEKFPELALWETYARLFGCDMPQAASLIEAGYITLESVAHANVAAIKKLPKFGPKSAPVTINSARRKLDLPPLEL